MVSAALSAEFDGDLARIGARTIGARWKAIGDICALNAEQGLWSGWTWCRCAKPATVDCSQHLQRDLRLLRRNFFVLSSVSLSAPPSTE